MAKAKELRRLTISDIQRILCWIFNLSKRPSFLPLRARDRPKAVNIVVLRDGSDAVGKMLSRLGARHTALVSEVVPIGSLAGCILRDGEYSAITPSLEYVRTEHLGLIPMVRLEDIHSSGTAVDNEGLQAAVDVSRYARACGNRPHCIVALDVEKVLTSAGKELGRVTVVGCDGHAIYDKVIKPREPVVDYLTRYSGLTKEIVDKGIDIAVVRSEVLNLIGADTVIVGHGIEHDLASLRLYHDKLVDTACLFPCPSGRKMSLAQLSRIHLNKTIHTDTHDSLVDATTCLELLSVKIQHMLRITDPNTPRLKIQASVEQRHVSDLQTHKDGDLSVVSCTCGELAMHLGTHKRSKLCLWMLVYEVGGSTYISF